MLQTYQPQLEAVIEHLKLELQKLRTSRATPSLVDDCIVETYGGARMRLKELATVGIPEPRTIVIKPWDKSIIKDIEKALIHCTLEFNPIIEAELLRIQLPELTEETRGKLVKKLHGILEENRIKIRAIRDEVKKHIDLDARGGKIPEDDKYKLIEKLNEMTRKFSNIIDELGGKKEEEITTI